MNPTSINNIGLQRYMSDIIRFFAWYNHGQGHTFPPCRGVKKRHWYKKGNVYYDVKGVGVCYIYPRKNYRTPV